MDINRKYILGEFGFEYNISNEENRFTFLKSQWNCHKMMVMK